MARLELSFFGTFSASLDGQPITGFESGKVRALLAYLAMQPERAHTRGALTALLWPEQAEDSARANLRQALANLRRAIGDPGAPAPFLLISREAIQFNPAADSWLDARFHRPPGYLQAPRASPGGTMRGVRPVAHASGDVISRRLPRWTVRAG